MLKKRSFITISILFRVFLCSDLSAQINISLPSANIVSRADYTVQLNTGTYTSLAGLIPVIDGRANNAQFNNTVNATILPLNVLYFRLASIGGVNLLTSSQEVVLSTSYLTTYTALATVLPGTVLMNYRVNTASQTWSAGQYTVPFQIRTSSVAILSGGISPQTQNINLTVPSFMQPQSAIGPTTIHVNQLDYFRSGGITATQPITFSSTVSYNMGINSLNSTFTFSSSHTYATTPQTNVSNAGVILSNQAGTSQINLSTANQSLSPAGSSAIPTGNNTTLNVGFQVSTVNLNAGFLKAGTYSAPLTYTWDSSGLQNTVNSELDVVVDDMADISLSQASVNMAFQNNNNYTQGVVNAISNHITLSNTTPFDLYVKASGDYLTSGANQIPVSVLSVEPMSGQTGVSSITLSSASQQIINAADPAIDRHISMQYRIPANKVSLLLGKPAGSYTTTITYSFVAL